MTSSTVQFGKKFREEHFLFPKSFVPLNHGSFGAVPKEVQETYLKYAAEDASRPDEVCFMELSKLLEGSLKSIAAVLNTSHENLTFARNSSFAANLVLRNFPFKQGDSILISSVIYFACGATIDYVVKKHNLKLITLELNYPLSDEEVVSKFEEKFKTEKIRFAFFDTVCSMPGVKLPFTEIIQLCKKYEVVSCIDGAHSLGMLPIDLSTLGCDFYFSNLHKWYYCPRGAAVLYVNPKFHDDMQTFPISWSYNETKFHKRFLVTGTDNYNSFLCVQTASKFVDKTCGGWDNVRKYCNDLRKEAIKSFETADVKSTHFGVLENEERSLSTFMFNVLVKLDDEKKDYFKAALSKPEFQGDLKEFLFPILFKKYNTFIPFGYQDGSMYLRFSCQIYNEVDEYVTGYNQFLAALDLFFQSEVYKKYL